MLRPFERLFTAKMLPGLYLCVSTKFQLDLNGIDRKVKQNHQLSDKTRLKNNSKVHSFAELKYFGAIILLTLMEPE